MPEAVDASTARISRIPISASMIATADDSIFDEQFFDHQQQQQQHHRHNRHNRHHRSGKHRIEGVVPCLGRYRPLWKAHNLTLHYTAPD